MTLLMSHPVWVRGLKPKSLYFSTRIEVAPRVGAWIETDYRTTRFFYAWVAPRVGAGIETCYPWFRS